MEKRTEVWLGCSDDVAVWFVDGDCPGQICDLGRVGGSMGKVLIALIFVNGAIHCSVVQLEFVTELLAVGVGVSCALVKERR